MRNHLVLLTLASLALSLGCSDDHDHEDESPTARRAAPAAKMVARLGSMLALPHSAEAFAIDISPDGKTVITGSFPYGLPGKVEGWDAATGEKKRDIIAHTIDVICLAYSPDGKRIAVSHDKRVDILDATGDIVLCKMGVPDGITDVSYWSVRWSPDGRQLAAIAPQGRRVLVWNSDNGEVVHAWAEFADVNGVDFFDEGKRLLVYGDKFMHVYATDTQELETQIDVQAREVTGAVVANGDESVVAATRETENECRLREWDLQSGKQQREFDVHSGFRVDLRLVPGTSHVASAGWSGGLRIWDLETGQLVDHLQTKGASPRFCAVSEDGTRITAASRRIVVWDMKTKTPLFQSDSHQRDVFAVNWTSDGRNVISSSGDGTIREWNAETGAQERVLIDIGIRINALALDADERRIAAGCADGAVRVWDMSSVTLLTQLGTSKTPDDPSVNPTVFAVQFLEDQARIIAAGADQHVRLWKVDDGTEISATSFPDAILRFGLSADQTVVGVGAVGRELELWDIGFRKRIRRVPQSGGPLFPVFAFSPAAAKLAVCTSTESSDGEFARYFLSLLDLETKEEVWKSPVGAAFGYPVCCAVSPDGQLVAIGSALGPVQVWSARNGELQRECTGHQAGVSALAFSPDGKRLSSASSDTTVIIWDTDL